MTKQNKIWTIFMSILAVIMACLIAIIVWLEHDEAEKARLEIKELQGLIMSR